MTYSQMVHVTENPSDPESQSSDVRPNLVEPSFWALDAVSLRLTLCSWPHACRATIGSSLDSSYGLLPFRLPLPLL